MYNNSKINNNNDKDYNEANNEKQEIIVAERSNINRDNIKRKNGDDN